MGKKLFKRSAAIVLMLMVLSTGLVVNAEGSYTVKEGDYLKKIAQSAYGDSARWEDIYEANKATVKNPAILYKGQTLILPDIDPVPSTETGTENTAMALEQWTMSEECGFIESILNDITVESMGLAFELKADSNTLVFIYHYLPEVWGETTGEEMAAYFGDDELEAMVKSMVEGFPQEFEDDYGIKIDGIRYVFVASDGVPFYSLDIKNE